MKTYYVFYQWTINKSIGDFFKKIINRLFFMSMNNHFYMFDRLFLYLSLLSNIYKFNLWIISKFINDKCLPLIHICCLNDILVRYYYLLSITLL